MKDEQKHNAGYGVSGLTMGKPTRFNETPTTPATPVQNNPAAQNWGTQNFHRTVNNVKQTAQAATQHWQNGNHVQAIGQVAGSVLDKKRLAKDMLVDMTETSLNHSLFPISETIRKTGNAVGVEAEKFRKGYFNEADNPAPQTTPATPTGGLPQQAQPNESNTAKQGFGLNPEMLRQAQSGSLNSNQGNFGLNVNMPTMPNFNQQPERPFVATFGKTPDDNERRALLNAALTPHKGAKNGQLTANQLNAARGLLESEQRNAIDLQKAQEQLANQYQIAQNNNANALQRDWLQQTGGLNRDALNHFANLQREQLSQQGQNQRNALSGSLDMARMAENARQFDVKAAFDERKNQVENAKTEREQALLQRMDGLRERLLATNDDKEKSAIARELSILSGQGEPQEIGLKEQLENIKAQRELALMTKTDELREKLMNTEDKKERAELSRQLAILTGQM